MAVGVWDESVLVVGIVGSLLVASRRRLVVLLVACRRVARCPASRPVRLVALRCVGIASSFLSAGRGAEKMTAPPCASAPTLAVFPRPLSA